MSATPTTNTRTNVVSIADEEAVKKVLVDSVLGLWDVVNNLTRVRPTKHDRYRVTIFGSARAKPGTVAYEETKRVSTALAAMGCDIITGGGPGLMQAANEGVDAGSDSSKSMGIRVDLPFEQEVNPRIYYSIEKLKARGQTVKDLEMMVWGYNKWTGFGLSDEQSLSYILDKMLITNIDSLFEKYQVKKA